MESSERARCGRVVKGKRTRCVRPERHRGICAVRSRDLEGPRAKRPRVDWRAQLQAMGLQLQADPGAEFCELVCDVGLVRSAELLAAVRALTAEFRP